MQTSTKTPVLQERIDAINAELIDSSHLLLDQFLRRIFLCPADGETLLCIASRMFWGKDWPAQSLLKEEIEYLAQLTMEYRLPLRYVESYAQLWRELQLLKERQEDIVTCSTTRYEYPSDEPVAKHQVTNETVYVIGSTRLRVLSLYCLSLTYVPEDLVQQQWETYAQINEPKRMLELSYVA